MSHLHHQRVAPIAWRTLAALTLLGCAQAASAQAPLRKIGEMELRLMGVSATVDPPRPVVPKNIPSAIRIVVGSGGIPMPLADALRFLGPLVEVKGDLSGPGLSQTVSLPLRAPEDPLPADPFLLPLPGLTVSGNYTLANLRIESGGRSVLDVTPSTITVEVIEQVLVTSVKTRALTLDEIKERGIVLDSDDYLGFEFTMGMKVESQPVNLTFPVVFDRQGVAIPEPLLPPPAPPRQGLSMPSVVPLLLEPEPPPDDDNGLPPPRVPIVLPNGEPVRIPAVLVIPGNVGYLKQFFSAQLFVANGAPAGSGLTVRNVTGTVRMPPGADLEGGTDDDPLALPETTRGPQPETMPVLGLGPDGKIGTEDDDPRFSPGEQGEAEFLIRGEREGFHPISFDIAATLEGLASGPVGIKGKASGGVLVRNPFFDMTFTLPATVRRNETFKLYASVTNIGQGLANDVTVSLDAAAISGCRLLSDAVVQIDTLAPGDSKTVAFEFESQRTGQAVASYLKLEGAGHSGGNLRFSLGVGERGVPLSPDTLVLPAAVDSVPQTVVDAAMRVLGQAWSVANAPTGTLPRGVLRTSKTVVVAKALALAEAGLRISLGQDAQDSLEALDYDFFAGTPRDAGFDQLLRDTEAGRALRQVFGGAAPTQEPAPSGSGPRLAAAAVIGPEVLSGAGPFGLHAILVFDRILDDASAAEAARYEVPDNSVRTAKAVLSGRLVVVNLARPEGPYVPTTIAVRDVLDRAGRRGSGSVPLTSRLEDPGAVVSGRVITADGAAVTTASVVYTNNTELSCYRPLQTGLATRPVDGDGRFEYRYVRRDNCGLPFEMVTQDPATGAQRKSTGFVRAAGERIVLDIVLMGRGAVEGTVRDLQPNAVAGAKVTVLSQTDPQSGGQATTDAFGRYRVEGITVGPVSVKAGKGIVIGHSAGRLDRAGTTATVDVVLDGGAVKVAGTVRRLEGGVETVVPGVYVFYSIDPNPYPTTVGYARTGPDGRFQLTDMPAGFVGLSARLDTGESASTPFFATAAGDNLTGKDLLFEIASPAETGSVEGVVLLPDNSEAAEAIVRIGTRGVRADAHGGFRIDGVEVIPNLSRTIEATSRDGRRRGSSSFLLNSPGQVAPAVIRLSGIGAVAFTVQGPTGATLVGQDVAVLRACGPCGCDVKTTDSDGRVRWEGVGVGSFEVQAIREVGGNYEAARGIASVTRDGETAFGVLRFLGTGTVSGIVLDPTVPEGRPSFGAEVRLSSNHFVYDPGQGICGMVQGPSHSARTGVDGRFRFTGVGMGAVNASAQQEFFPTPVGAAAQMTQDGQEVPLTLRLVSTTAGILSGTVFLPDGTTPAGRGVLVTATGVLPDVVVETNDQGRFRFARIFPQGFYRLTASDPATGGVSQTQVYLQAGQDLVNDLRLKGRGTVRVSVVDGLGDGVDNAYVKLQETDFPRRSYEGSADPSNHGVVVFDGVYEGPFSVEAADVFARGGRASSTVPRAGEVVNVTVRVTTTGKVTGRFLKQDRTTPIPNGVVKLIVASRVIGQITTPSAGEHVGRFSFDYVPAGPVRLEAEDPLTGRTGVAVGTIETESQTLPLNVYAQAIGSVHGTVTSNGAPQPLAFVDVISGSFRAATQSDAEGDYLVDGVPEGQVKVQASLAQGFLQGTNIGNLEGEGQPLDLDVALRGSGRVTGQVLAADNITPAPTSHIHVSVGGQGGGSLAAVTDTEGRFAFERVPAGQAFVQADVVSSIDGASASVVVPEAGEVEVPLRLNGLGSISGETVDGSGNLVAGFVSISGPKGGLFVSVGETGRFEVRDILAGPYTAQLRVTNGGISLFGSKAFEVVPGESVPLRLELQPSGSVTGLVRRPGNVVPAYGTEVTLRVSATGSELSSQAQSDGSFTFRGVPLGAFTLRARDAVTGGLANLAGRSIDANGQLVDVGLLVLDATAPVLVPIQPVPGSVRAGFAGPLVIDVTDVGAGIDSATLTMIPGGVALVPFTFGGNRATTTLSTAMLAVGENRLVAQVKDLAGNVSTTEWRFTVTGGILRGSVRGADGSLGAGVPLRLNGVAKPPADAQGNFVFTGLRGGNHTIEGTDPVTGLTSWIQVALGDGEDLTIAEPLRLPAFGRITGIVRHAGTASPAAGVTVNVQTRSTVSGADGTFDLGPFPLGSYGLSATGPDGDRGAGTAVLTALGQTVSIPITLNGLGTVEVVLRDSRGDLVAGASVVVSSSSPYGVGRSGTTGPTGAPAVIVGVFSGTITARATHPTSGLVGETQGVLQPGGNLQLSANLQPSGRVAGIVSRREGGPAAGVEVRMTQPRSLTRTSDAAGAFAFEDVPLGSWGLSASDPATQDVGQASGTLAEAGATANGNITLNGVGTVRVRVVDAGSNSVPGAAVSVSSSAGRGYSGTTGSDGVATFTNVLAGSITATSTHPTNGTRGSDAGTLAAAGSLDLLTPLQATGTLTGIIFAPDGDTPFAGAVVTATGPAVTTGSDGVYEFRDVAVGTYTVSASVGGRLRARGTSTLATNGDVAAKDLVLVGTATVSGRVTRASGAASGARISLYSPVSLYGGYFEATADAEGDYFIDGVPIGPFTIGASLGPDRADGTGTVVASGVGVTVNLSLLSSAVTLPLNLYDGNEFLWQVAKDGTLSHGVMSSAPEYVGRLEVTRGGATAAFAGPECPPGPACSAATEENKREVVLQQPDLLGLQASRKVYAASDGYFVRQLDVLRNPGPDPATVDVRLVSHFGASTVQATSSGDAEYAPADRWLSLDDADAMDPWRTSSPYWAFWPIGIGTAGNGGQAPASVSSSVSAGGGRTVGETWSSVTLAPGQTIAFLRFFAAQNDRERARASAERLTSLPPEALVGLTPEEAAAVVNFAVPVDLVSALPALPPNDGAVTGRVFAGDGVTVAGSHAVVFRSRSPHYGRPLTVASNNAGDFQVVAGNGLVPRTVFDLTSSATVLGETMTATSSGDFPLDGEGRPLAATTANLAFTGSGALEVVVTRTDASPVANTNLYLQRGPQSVYVGATNAAGRLVFPLVTPGPLQIRVSFYGGPEVLAPATVVADQLTRVPVGIADFGVVRGTLRTAAGLAVSSYVSITEPGVFTRSVLAAADGSFELTDIPFGTYTLTAQDTYRSAATSSVAVVVVGPVTDVEDIRLPPVGRVNVVARVGSPTGPPLASAAVSWKSASRGPDYVFTGYADSIGHQTINYVSGPEFRVKVAHPGTALSFTETPLTSIAEGQVIDLPVVVPGVVTLAGTLRSRDGFPQPYSSVQVYSGSAPTLVVQLGTGADGTFNLANIPVGSLRLRSECNRYYINGYVYGRGEVERTAANHGETLTQDAVCPLGAIASTRRRDFWTFDAQAGSSFALTLAPGAAATPLADPFLEVHGPEGVVAVNDNRTVNDKAAVVAFTAPSAGAYVVVVRAAGAESGSYHLGGSPGTDNPYLRAYEPPRVVGTLTKDWNPVAVAGHPVRLLSGATVVEATTTAGDGGFDLGVFPLGAFTLEATDAEGVVVARATGSAATPGTSVTQNLVVPARGTVSVTVRRGPLSLPGVAVTLSSDHAGAFEEDRVRTRSTGSNGTLTTTLPAGSVTARATDPLYAGVYEATGVLGDDGSLSLDIALPESPTRLFGTVTSGNGNVPLPGALVTLVGPATLQATTDVFGSYEFPAVPPGAYSLGAALGGASATQAVSAGGGDLRVDLRVAISIVRGRITEADGTTPARARVELCQSGQCVQQESGADGLYAFYGGLPPWLSSTVSLVAAPPENLSYGASRSFVYAPGTVMTVNVELPVFSAIFGFVRDTQGAPVPSTVTFTDYSSGQVFTQVTGPDGSYRFGRRLPWSTGYVTVGAVSVHGFAASELRYLGGGDQQIDLTMPQAAAFAGQLYGATGDPLGNVAISFEAPDAMHPGGYAGWTTVIPVDAGGHFEAVVPAGTFRAFYDPNQCSSAEPSRRLVAVADGVLDGGSNAPFTMRLGEGGVYPLLLAGPLGRYGRPYGSDGDLCGPAGDVSLRSDGPIGGASTHVRVAADGRRATTLRSGGALDVRREQFVPASGAFIREVVWVSNPGAEDVQAEVGFQSEFGDRPSWQLGADSNGNGSFEATDSWAWATVPQAPLGDGSWREDPGGPAREAGLAFGSGAVSVHFVEGGWVEGFVPPYMTARFQVTVPAGQRIGLMAFAVGRLANHGTPGTIRALADLSDPEALDGLADEDRERIVNFVVPSSPAPATGVEGTVTRDTQPLASARVSAVDPVRNAVVALGSTDVAGRFLLRGLPAGEVRIVAVDPGTNRPGSTMALVAEGSLARADVAVMGAAEMAEVRGVVRDTVFGEPIAGARVSASSDIDPLWTGEVATDPTGAYALAVPPGTVRLRVDGNPESETSLLLGSGETGFADFGAPAAASVGGTVTRDDESVADAYVVASDPGTGNFLGQANTDSTGRFVILGLPGGPVRLVAIDPQTGRPGATDVVTVVGSRSAADVSILAASEMGQVQGTVRSSGTAVAGAYVSASSVAFPGWYGEATTGSAGEYTLQAPPGVVDVVSSVDWITRNSGSLAPGGTLLLDIDIP